MASGWSEESVARFRALLSAIEAPDFKPAHWDDFSKPNADGVYQMPYPTYAPIVEEMWDFLSGHGLYKHPYELLPEDPPGSKAGTETHLILKTVADIQAATLNQIGRYFMLCRRAERFADGHIDEEFLSGKLPAALRRVGELMGVLD